MQNYTNDQQSNLGITNQIDFKKIYENAFSIQDYNLHDNEEPRFQFVNNFIKKNIIKSMLDVGSGRGNVLQIVQKCYPEIELISSDLKKFHNLNVPFYEIDLCNLNSLQYNVFSRKYDLITCLDVLEHLEKNCIENVLNCFSNSCQNCLLSIANHSDVLNGVELHIIQENMSYWKPLIEKYFTIRGFTEEYSGRLFVLTLVSKKGQVIDHSNIY